jgi:hypothetical protein
MFSVSVCSKQMEVFFLFAENKRKLPFSVSSVFPLRNSVNMETWKWRHQAGNANPGDFLSFAHHADGSLWLVRLLMKKQTEVICLQTA